MEELMHLDLYGLLEVSPSSTSSQIKTAYRKKALSCHPDKNPDNPKAGELFHQLSRVLEILTDESARSAYDKVLQSKEQAKERAQKLDARRKKFKDDLEAREEKFRNAGEPGKSGKSDEEKLKEEIERLQKAGSRLVEEEVNFINEQIRQQLRKNRTEGREGQDEGSGKVKIRWRVDNEEKLENGGYSREVLTRIMSKYGDVSGVVLSGKGGRALVEFKERSAAEMAVGIERGLVGNPLKLEGMWEGAKVKTEGLTGSRTERPKPTGSRTAEGLSSRLFPTQGDAFRGPSTFPSFSSAPDIFGTTNDEDFETMVLANLRRAEERRKIIHQMMEENKTS
ncbi:dnaJ homolog subfamily C member 17 [Fopius arisanus]|uniref:DnaJ homolog subfamily C member 17 n=1 Tax=Fopius arisanus TaxID=64838 RepID=A0A0C9QB50_9HYME|nr:PREDICTED: dnaJ homolog subfamily C member 17 [Fopius arisanus]